MSICDKCGASRDDNSAACSNCEHSVVDQEAPSSEASSLTDNRSTLAYDRPTGGAFIISGWIFMGLSVAAWLIGRMLVGGAARQMTNFSESGQMMVTGAWLTDGAGTLFSYGIFLLAAGYIIRAIWFVPGPERKMAG